MNNKTPKWFQDWHSNEFSHLTSKVARIDKLVWLILGAIIAAAIATLFLG